MQTVQQFRGGSQGARDKLNDMGNVVNGVAQIRGDEVFIRVGRYLPGGCVISLNIDKVAERVGKRSTEMRLVKLSSSVTGRVGWYNAKSQMTAGHIASSGGLAGTDIAAVWSATEDVFVQYVPDLGASTPSITDFSDANLTNLIKSCHWTNVDVSGRMVVTFSGGGGGGVSIPVGQYPGMYYGTLTNNVNGYSFITAHAMY